VDANNQLCSVRRRCNNCTSGWSVRHRELRYIKERARVGAATKMLIVGSAHCQPSVERRRSTRRWGGAHIIPARRTAAFQNSSQQIRALNGPRLCSYGSVQMRHHMRQLPHWRECEVANHVLAASRRQAGGSWTSLPCSTRPTSKLSINSFDPRGVGAGTGRGAVVALGSRWSLLCASDDVTSRC